MDPVTRILSVLDRHVTGPADIRLMGGAALILGYGRRRSTEDVDLLLDDAEATFLAEERALGPALEKTNAELEPEGLYLTHIWGPEQQILTPTWRVECRRLNLPALLHLRVSTLGPLDLITSKLCRADEGDLQDVRFLVESVPLARAEVLHALATAVVPEEFREVWPEHRARVEALW